MDYIEIINYIKNNFQRESYSKKRVKTIKLNNIQTATDINPLNKLPVISEQQKSNSLSPMGKDNFLTSHRCKTKQAIKL